MKKNACADNETPSKYVAPATGLGGNLSILSALQTCNKTSRRKILQPRELRNYGVSSKPGPSILITSLNPAHANKSHEEQQAPHSVLHAMNTQLVTTLITTPIPTEEK